MGEKSSQRTQLFYRLLALAAGLSLILLGWALFRLGWVRLASSLAVLGFVLCDASVFGNLLGSGNG